MGRFIKGDIVVINFPFSDLSGTRRRPALVIATLEGDDIVLCQITSQLKTDKYAIILNEEDYANGKLKTHSMIRPNKIFTADKNSILYLACKIAPVKIDEVVTATIDIIKGSSSNDNSAI